MLPNLVVVVVLYVLSRMLFCQASDRADQRYSYSLTTFDPSGKLNQVERAMQAAEQGTYFYRHISGGVIAPLSRIHHETGNSTLRSQFNYCARTVATLAAIRQL